MNLPPKTPNWAVGVCLGTAVCWFGGFAIPSIAQNEGALAERTNPAIEASDAHAADPTGDEDIRQGVETALHSDPYFYDAHVVVSLKRGDIQLDGFVFSDWDLLHALSVARKAAGKRRVVDNLSIEIGGRR